MDRGKQIVKKEVPISLRILFSVVYTSNDTVIALIWLTFPEFICVLHDETISGSHFKHWSTQTYDLTSDKNVCALFWAPTCNKYSYTYNANLEKKSETNVSIKACENNRNSL